MKNKHLVALAVFVVLLFVTRAVLKRHDDDVVVNLAEAGVGRVIAMELKPSDVTWIQVGGPPPVLPKAEAAEATVDGGMDAAAPVEDAPAATPAAEKKPEEPKTPLRVERSGSTWTVASAHGAPADSKQVDEFVTSLLDLAGEVRGEGETAYAEFGVDEASATRIEIGTGAGAPAAVILVGKQGDSYDAHFARADGSPVVRHVTEGVRRGLGLYGESKAPNADQWVKKDVLSGIDQAKVTRVTAERPDARLVLEKQTAVTPEAPPADGAPPPPPATEWVVVEPRIPWSVRSDGLPGVVSRMTTARAMSVLDAAATPACGVEPPSATVTLEQEGGAAQSVHVGGKVPDREEAAVNVGGGPVCWSFASWAVQSLLPQASSIWTIPDAFPGAPVASEAKAVTITRGGQAWRLTKASGDAWTWEGRGEASSSRVQRIASAVVGLRFDDLADESKVSPAAKAVHATVRVDAGGKRMTVTLLGERAGTSFGERYVRVEGGNPPPAGFMGVLGKSRVDSLLPSESELRE